MRRLITGVDDQGRSCVVEEDLFGIVEAQPSTMRTASVKHVYQTTVNPPPPRPESRDGSLLDLQLPPGHTRWIHLEFAPGADGYHHHTDTIDFDTVVAGSVDLVLDDGPHPLRPGDCVVVAGVDHAWKAGAEGCTLSIVMVGTPAPAD